MSNESERVGEAVSSEVERDQYGMADERQLIQLSDSVSDSDTVSDSEIVSDNEATSDTIIPESEEVCMICSEHRLEGLRLGGEFICEDCEREIVRTDVRDAKYPFFIHRMKQLFQKKNA